MRSGEGPAAEQNCQPGVCVAARDEDTGPRAAVLVPLDSDSVGSILRCNAHRSRKTARPEAAEPDQTDPRNRMPVDELRAKRRRKQASDRLGIDPVVHEQPTLDFACHSW